MKWKTKNDITFLGKEYQYALSPSHDPGDWFLGLIWNLQFPRNVKKIYHFVTLSSPLTEPTVPISELDLSLPIRGMHIETGWFLEIIGLADVPLMFNFNKLYRSTYPEISDNYK